MGCREQRRQDARARVEADALWFTAAIHLTTRINWYTKIVYTYAYDLGDDDYVCDSDDLSRSDSDDSEWDSDCQEDFDLNDLKDEEVLSSLETCIASNSDEKSISAPHNDSTCDDQSNSSANDMLDEQPDVDVDDNMLDESQNDVNEASDDNDIVDGSVDIDNVDVYPSSEQASESDSDDESSDDSDQLWHPSIPDALLPIILSGHVFDVCPREWRVQCIPGWPVNNKFGNTFDLTFGRRLNYNKEIMNLVHPQLEIIATANRLVLALYTGPYYDEMAHEVKSLDPNDWPVVEWLPGRRQFDLTFRADNFHDYVQLSKGLTLNKSHHFDADLVAQRKAAIEELQDRLFSELEGSGDSYCSESD